MNDANGNVTNNTLAGAFDMQLPTGAPSDPTSSLVNVSIGLDGLVTATFANGEDQMLGKVAMATFPTMSGLRPTGDAHWQSTGESGPPTIDGPTSGSMGYSVPAAVAAKIAEPKRTVVALAGDGEFLMNGQEIATAAQYGAPIITLVVNNGMYGTIRMHQEREYPGRVSGTELKNPDFAAYARAFGGHGEVVEKTEDFAAAYERAAASGKPALVELRIDPDAITPATTLSAIREKALKSGR